MKEARSTDHGRISALPRKLDVQASSETIGNQLTEVERVIACNHILFACMDLLAPHISEACAGTRLRQRLDTITAALDDSNSSRGMIVLNADVRPCFSNHAARLLLSRFCESGRPPAVSMLPEPVRSWVDRQIAAVRYVDSDRTPLEMRREGAVLLIQLASAADARCHLLLMEESGVPPLQSKTERQGLTRRESEVLKWVARGKTNEEIGIILGTSIHTVKSHVKRILAHLGVETRTAAAAAAWALEQMPR